MEQTLALVAFLVILFFLARWFGGIGVGAPWLPVRKQDIEAAFRLVHIGPEDVVVDLGSGDGRLLAACANKGARVIGYELNPFLAWFSRLRLSGVENRARIYQKNLLKADLSQATVIFIFGIGSLMPAVSQKLRREASSEARIISFAFEIPELTRIRQEGIALLYRLR